LQATSSINNPDKKGRKSGHNKHNPGGGKQLNIPLEQINNQAKGKTSYRDDKHESCQEDYNRNQ